MKTTIYARQLDNGIWQWRLAGESDWANDDYYTGDNEALVESVESAEYPSAHIMLAGQSVVAQSVEVDQTMTRHMAKVLPYEMEDYIVDPVEDLHFSFVASNDELVNALYVRTEHMQSALSSLEGVGCDVQKVLPDYLLLDIENDGAIFVLEEGLVHGRVGEGFGFSVEITIAPLIISQLTQALGPHNRVILCADNLVQAEGMKVWLPEAWKESDGPEIDLREGGFWDCIKLDRIQSPLNLRRGVFARQLPIFRWAKAWKIPATVFAIAFVIALVSNSVQYITAKGKADEIRAEIYSVYKEVAPNGRSRDPVRALESMVSKGGNKGKPSNVIQLMDVTAKAIKATPSIKVTNMRYVGDKRELRLNVETAEFSALEAMRNTVEKLGFTAELLRVNAQGELQKASVRIAEG